MDLVIAHLHSPVLLVGAALASVVLLGLVAARTISGPLERRVAERTAALVEAQAQLLDATVQIAESEAKFRAMFEQSPMGVALADPSTGALIEVNERLLQLIGRTSEELVTSGWMAATHPDDLGPELERLNRLRAGEIGSFQMEKRYLRPDGTLVWVDITVSSVAMGSDQRQLHLCLVEDITARKDAEARLQASELKMRKMLEHIPTPIAVSTLGPDSAVTYLNQQFMRTYGYTLEDIPTLRDWARRAYPDETYRQVALGSWREAVGRVSAVPGAVESQEFLVTRKDGQQRDVLISATVIDGMVLGVLVDMTERKQYELDLRLARDAAEQANRAKTEFLAHMTHELRTPLHAILGFTEILALAEDPPAPRLHGDAPTEAGPRRRQLLATIQRNGRHLLALINDVLDLSRIEGGGLVLEAQAVNLHTLLSDCAWDLLPVAEDQGLEFYVEFASELPVCVLMDGRRLVQVIHHLLGNAVKFTARGAVRLQAEATPDAGNSRLVELRITVADTGPGIPAADRGHLFDPFIQADPMSGPGSPQGSGLGLAISRRLARLMGGELVLDSPPDAGSRFTLTIPGVPVADAAECDGQDPLQSGASLRERAGAEATGPGAGAPARSPPAAALRELRELAEQGRTTRLEDWCRRWSVPERRPAFAARVLELALAFENARIVELVDACLGEQPADPSPVPGRGAEVESPS